MKQSTKSTLLSALFIFAVGVLLSTVIFIISVCTGYSLFATNHEHNYTSSQYNLKQLLSTCGASENANLTELSLQLQAADVQVLKTDGESRLEIYNFDAPKYDFSYSSGTVCIQENEEVNRFGFSVRNGEIAFSGLRHFFNPNSTRKLPTILFYLNSQDTLTAIQIQLTVGSLIIDTPSENTALYLSTSVGNISLSNCVSPDQALDARTTVGHIEVNNIQYNAASLNTTVGNITVSSSACESLKVSALVGNLFFSFDNQTAYNTHANTTLGIVTLQNGTANGSFFSQNIGADFNANFSTTVGNISLNNFGN